MRVPLRFLLRLRDGLASRVRNLWFRALGMQIDGYAWIRSIDVPRHHDHIRLGNRVALDQHVSLISSEGEIVIGERSYLNRHTIVDSSQSIHVGKDCMLGPFCYLTDHDHQADGQAPPSQGTLIEAPTKIGNNVWLGARVTVLKGVYIGDHTVVAAGSVVTKDLPPGVLAMGSPAKVVRPLRELEVALAP